MRVLREEIRRARVNVREIAAPAARNANFFAQRFGVVDQEHTAATLPRARRAKHSSRAGADDDRVEMVRGHATMLATEGFLSHWERSAARPGEGSSTAAVRNL